MHYPVEGYYYKTEGLKKYFQLIRNLQENEDVYSKINLESKEIKDLVWLLRNTVWGTVPSQRTKSPFPRQKDILTVTMDALQIKPMWTIPNILSTLKDWATGVPNLVELAYLTKDIRCLTAGAETNALYREFAVCFSGCIGSIARPLKIVNVYHWKVSEDVQSLGEKLVDKYNEILNKFVTNIAPVTDYTPSAIPQGSRMLWPMETRKNPKLLIGPTEQNQESMLSIQELETPRVAMLGLCKDDGQYYHWILDNDKVTEAWSNGMITTENYINKTGPEMFDITNWDWSGVDEKNENGETVTDATKLWSLKNDNGYYQDKQITPGEIQLNGATISWSQPNVKMK